MLIFEPREGSHVLTGTYGVIEQSAAASAEAAFNTFLGDAAGAFEGLTTIANYDREDNFARRLKTLSGLTPYEYICKVWTSEPDRFIVDPIHQMPGLNT